MRIPAKFLQDAVTVLILFMTTGAFESLIVDGSDPQAATTGSPVMWLVWSLLYAVIALRLIPRHREVVALLRANSFLFILVSLTILSALWSEDPGFTLRHGVALVATTLLGIDLAVRHSIHKQLQLLYIALSIFVFLSIAVQLLFPGFIPYLDYGEEAWHGILSNKNTWAKVIVLATIAMLCASRRTRWRSVLVGGLVIVAIALVVGANSKGSLIFLAVMLVFFKISDAFRWNPKALTLAGIGVSLAAVPLLYLLFSNFDNLTALVGRDATLTGRSRIWEMTLSSIAKRPFLGYGYLAFWSPSSQEAMRIREELNWQAPHAHNGFIDVTLGMGLLGLVLYFAAYAIALKRAVLHLRAHLQQEAMWPTVYLVFTFFCQLTESSIVAANSIFWILYIAAACSVTMTEPERLDSPVGITDNQSTDSARDLDAIQDFA